MATTRTPKSTATQDAPQQGEQELRSHVRVSDEVRPRREFTVTREQYYANQENFELLDKPALRPDGEPIPPKYHTTVDAEAAKNAARSTNQTPDADAATGDQTVTEPADDQTGTPAGDQKE